MTRIYDSQCFLDDMTTRYHRRTGKYPTKTEAVKAIRQERRINLPPPRKYWSREFAKKRIYSRSMALELIRRIQESDEPDPVRIIYEVYDWMDEMICSETNGKLAWQFASAMKDAIREILELLE